MEVSEIKKILESLYGWNDPAIKLLVGYETLNYRIKVEDKYYVLKIQPFDEQVVAEVKGESFILDHLCNLKCDYPKPIPTLSGKIIALWGEKYIVRVLSFLDGSFLAEVDHNEKLINSFGAVIANLNLATKDLYIAAIKAKNISWDLNNTHLSRDNLHNIDDPKYRALVDYFLLQFDLNAKPVLHNLPHQIIHNDANDWNVLCTNHTISGIIDFGDTVYSTRVSEIAVALSYIMVNEKDPIKKGCTFLRSYHEVYPIEVDELKLLYYFIAARICVSLISSAASRKANPDNTYISVSEKGFCQLINQWISINPIYATNHFLKACGYTLPTTLPIEEVISVRKKYIPNVYSISYKHPIQMDSAAFQYMYDKEGNTFLDAYNNIPHVGHEHPSVVRAAQTQLAKLNTNTRYLFDPLQEYSKKLLSKFPSILNQVFLVNSGSAASDLAMRLARNFTKCNRLIVMEHGYHGNTQEGIAISHYKYASKGGKGKNQNIIEAPLPNAYVDGFHQDPSTTGIRYANKLIQSLESKKDVAAFIAEPISGCGGQVPLAKNYLSQLYPFLERKNILRISDEVQTGFGRLGSHYWGFEMHGVIPDIVILGKPIGNGHPMAAVVTTQAIADAFHNGMEFFSSFGGNPVSCKIGSSVLDVIEKEKLQEQAKKSGDHFIDKMKSVKERFKVIGDVRGHGLFLGIEFIKPNPRKYIPNSKLASQIKNALRLKHILVSTDGPFDNVIKMKPPLCFTKENVEFTIAALIEILNELQTNSSKNEFK